MKKKPLIILMIWSLLVTLAPAKAYGDDVDDAISRLKLRQESLPEGIKILTEVRATRGQLFKTRRKIGFPLTALLNQAIAHGDHQARVNYMALPAENWVDFGYSKLMHSEGHKSLIVAKDGVLIQMIASTRELEDWLLLLLGIDKLQIHKIRFHRSPKGWTLTDERFVKEEELRPLEQNSGGTIPLGIAQDMMINRSKVKIQYYECGTEESANLVGESLAQKKSSITKRLVRGYGSIVVAVDSSSDELNKTVLSYMD